MTEPARTVDAVAEVLRSAGLLRELHGPGDVTVLGVSQDSRAVEPGDLFLAWQGSVEDAHLFVPAAVEAGAVAAVVERHLPVPVAQIVVEDGRRAAALASSAVMGGPSEALLAVAITGTNGKTTTALLIRHLLSRKMRTAAIGTLGLVGVDGVPRGGESLTTPGPVQVAEWLRSLVDESVEAVVMEASSHALDQRRLDGVAFDVAVFTNLSQDHLDYHGDLLAYFAAKARLMDLVVEDGTVVVNGDDRAWDALDLRGRQVRTFALDRAADLRAEDLSLDATGSSFALVVDGERRPVRLPLVGRYNVENALAAAAAARTVGLSIDEIAVGLASAPPVPGRLETVASGPFSVLIDFAHTPAALTGVLTALQPLKAGRLIVVFGAGGDRDRAKRVPMAEAVGRLADVVVLTSDNPRMENPERILDDLAVGLEPGSFTRIADRRAAIEHALGIARPGDLVVLAGKGHETYQIVGAAKQPFDERDIVHAFLGIRGAA